MPKPYDHVIGVPSATASLEVTVPGGWMIRASRKLGVPSDAPMVSGLRQGFSSTDFLRDVLRPALAHIRDDGGYPSSEFMRGVDLGDVQVRSFRRTATKAMRKAGVEPGMIDLILQWKQDKNSKMQVHYDEVDLEDTMEVFAQM